MNEISEAAIDAAEKAAAAKCTHEDIGDCWQECSDIRAALAAALPFIERQVRDKIAAEIEAERLTDDTGEPDDEAYNAAIDECARIARGADDIGAPQ